MLLVKRHRLERVLPPTGNSPPYAPPQQNQIQEISMTNLSPRDTFFQDMIDFRRNFDQVFNRFLRWPSVQEDLTHLREFSPAVASFIDRKDKKFHCDVELPGVDPKDVEIHVQGNTLTISGERTSTRETNEADYMQKEISY